MRVVTEFVPGVRSVSIGLWIKAGTRDETRSQAGVTHFLEHLIFKGTNSRSARQIAETFDSVGGELNAFSAKEYTCVYGRVIDKHLDVAVDVLSDLVIHPIFRPDDIDSERTVVLEEINMHEDAPSELVHDIFDSTLFHGHPLGPRILGTAKVIGNLDRKEVITYWMNGYATPNIVVAAAGNVEHNKLVGQIEAAFSDRTGGQARRRRARSLKAHAQSVVRPKETQQAHICYGMEGANVLDEDRYVLSIIDVVLGGGMSSRLFQKIREKRGLVYSVYSYRGQYADTGSLAVYAGTAPDKAEQVLGLIRHEFEALALRGVTNPELARAKEQLKGNLVLGLEDVTTRMNRLGRNSIYGAEILSADELIERVEAVTKADVSRVAADLFARPRTLAVIGPFEPDEFDRFV